MTTSRLFLATVFASFTIIAGSTQAAQVKDGLFLVWPVSGEFEEHNVGFGWGAGYEFHHYLSLDFSISRMVDVLEADIIDVPGFPPASEIELEIYSFALTLRAAYDVLSWVRLYGGAGVGFYWVNSEAEDVRKALDATPQTGPNGYPVMNANVDVNKDFGYHLAGGAEFLLADNLELFAELRSVIFDTEMDVEIQEANPNVHVNNSKVLTTVTDGFNYDHVLFRVGFNYRF